MLNLKKHDTSKCEVCGKESCIKSEPIRHLMSPNSINMGVNKEEEKVYLYYCSKECQKKDQNLTYACLAELDRNASDSECFEHIKWDGIYRIGRCKITGKEVRVEPLMPGDNSGQPKECLEHFVLRKKYQDIIDSI